MIPIEKLRAVTVVYSHKSCPDGLASAMILKDAFRMLGTSPRIEFLAHGTPEHRTSGCPLAHSAMSSAGIGLFCDIAPHPEIVDEVRRCGGIVLDHHVGAREIVESFGENGVYADAEKEPGVSGAVLAFQHVWKAASVEASDTGDYDHVRDFAYCVGVRDTWQTKDPRFQRGQWISKMLMSKPAAHWLELRAVWPDDATAGSSEDRRALVYLSRSEVEMGRALFEAHEEAVRQAALQCVGYSVQNGGYEADDGSPSPSVRLVVFQEQAAGFRLTSDVAEWYRKQNDTYQYEPSIHQVHVVAGFSYVVDKPGGPPRLLYSLRGLGFDVCAFAKANGGGGHTAAAGFSVPIDEVDVKGPYAHIRIALGEFLRGAR